MERDLGKIVSELLKKINNANIEELNNLVFLERDVDRITGGNKSGKVVYTVPKQYFTILENALKEAKQKIKEEEKEYNRETDRAVEEIFWRDDYSSNGKITSNIQSANNLSFENYKRETQNNSRKSNIHNKPKTTKPNMKYKSKDNKLKKIIKVAKVLLAGAVIATIGAKAAKCDTEKPAPQPIDPTISTETEVDYIQDVVDDFKQRYLDAYNEKYGTDYTEAEIIVTAIREGVVYQLNQNGNIKYVTLGSAPEETKKTLKELGEVEIVGGFNNVMQIISGENLLGTYDTLSQEFIYSGNQLGDLTNNEFQEPTLEEIGIPDELADKASKVVLSVSDTERSIHAREYDEELKKYLEKQGIREEVEKEAKEDEGFEIGD